MVSSECKSLLVLSNHNIYLVLMKGPGPSLLLWDLWLVALWLNGVNGDGFSVCLNPPSTASISLHLCRSQSAHLRSGAGPLCCIHATSYSCWNPERENEENGLDVSSEIISSAFISNLWQWKLFSCR